MKNAAKKIRKVENKRGFDDKKKTTSFGRRNAN